MFPPELSNRKYKRLMTKLSDPNYSENYNNNVNNVTLPFYKYTCLDKSKSWKNFKEWSNPFSSCFGMRIINFEKITESSGETVIKMNQSNGRDKSHYTVTDAVLVNVNFNSHQLNTGPAIILKCRYAKKEKYFILFSTPYLPEYLEDRKPRPRLSAKSGGCFLNTYYIDDDISTDPQMNENTRNLPKDFDRVTRIQENYKLKYDELLDLLKDFNSFDINLLNITEEQILEKNGLESLFKNVRAQRAAQNVLKKGIERRLVKPVNYTDCGNEYTLLGEELKDIPKDNIVKFNDGNCEDIYYYKAGAEADSQADTKNQYTNLPLTALEKRQVISKLKKQGETVLNMSDGTEKPIDQLFTKTRFSFNKRKSKKISKSKKLSKNKSGKKSGKKNYGKNKSGKRKSSKKKSKNSYKKSKKNNKVQRKR